MKKIIALLFFITAGISINKLSGQGPPITADKPIMLGGNSIIVKTLTEVRVKDVGTVTRMPLMFHYLPTANTLVAVHLPLVNVSYNSGFRNNGASFGDMDILAKYQFYRKDGMAKTFRMVAKTLQSLPTGKDLSIRGISTNKYTGYYGIVAGYEYIKYGISNEVAFEHTPSTGELDVLYKFGFGLPILEPIYPVKQLNFYFEPQVRWLTKPNHYELLYAQGVQFAIKRLTLEAAVQFELAGNSHFLTTYRHSIYLGTRFIF